MTGLIILTFIPFVVAIGFLVRLRGEQKERSAIEARMQILEQQMESEVLKEREWYGALTHELRSPLAAVLGYAELLEDGALGDTDERARDGVRRIRAAAEHLIQLVEGIEGVTFAGDQHPANSERVEARELMEHAADILQFDAEARRTTLTIRPTDVALQTSSEDAARAVALALGAAIKASPGTTLTLSADGGRDTTITIAGTRIDPQRDNPDNASASHLGLPLTGAAFRLALARHAARIAGGDLTLDQADGATAIVLRLGD
jgi:signal transduction histidine kinase